MQTKQPFVPRRPWTPPSLAVPAVLPPQGQDRWLLKGSDKHFHRISGHQHQSTERSKASAKCPSRRIKNSLQTDGQNHRRRQQRQQRQHGQADQQQQISQIPKNLRGSLLLDAFRPSTRNTQFGLTPLQPEFFRMYVHKAIRTCHLEIYLCTLWSAQLARVKLQ